MRRINRVYGTTWIRMAIPDGSTRPRRSPRPVAAGVLRKRPDFVVTINDQIPPRDPFYKDDDDPSQALRPVLRSLRSERWSIMGPLQGGSRERVARDPRHANVSHRLLDSGRRDQP
jgi:hypothetical protein